MAKVERAVKSRPLRTRNKFAREAREQKAAQAKERQAIYDALTTEQKIEKLNAGGFVAAKERAKLINALANKVQSAGQKVVDALTEAVQAEAKKERKGAKAGRQGRKDKKARTE